MMREFSSSPELTEAEVEEEEEEEEEEEPTSTSSKKKRKIKNKRRFSNEQVRSLETIFESETKLDPQKKVQVARELGLQPRQVAIWFQNKRARWKSKEMEKNYRLLKSKYDSLKARFKDTEKEKESLLSQLQELQNQLEKLHRGNCREDSVGDGANKSEQNMGNIEEITAERSMLEEELECQGALFSDDDHRTGSINAFAGQQAEPHLLNMDDHMHSILAPQANWCGFDSGSLFDQSNTTSHWWDSWT